MPLVPHPACTNLGCRAPLRLPLPLGSASGGTTLPRLAGHMTDTKAYGWAVSTINHVVLLGADGRREERDSEWERTVGDGRVGMG